MNASPIGALMSALSSRTLTIVDLTETLRPDFPVIQLPAEFAQAAPFSKRVLSRYDAKGPAWYWSDFTVCEHSGTHFDAPIHWVT